ncbi:MAG: glycosyltransferase [Desulfobacteraceae bacterium]|nr:MAG: glycosyltransferase [Desulfobacteraceae bacterium]
MIGSILQMGVALHIISMAGLILFGVHRLWLLICGRKTPCDPFAKKIPANQSPRVTIQLPLYNESRVAGRIINAAARIKWPLHLLEIQILDDSTDETQQIVDQRVAYWSNRGRDIRVIRRTSRKGYKAGALAHGLTTAKGEFLAIFDADFIPPPDFLKKTVPHFSDPGVGMVQTRWGFLNADFSWLTRMQALLLSPHFSVEHKVRFHRSLFFNFNGTAGIWRRTAIEGAGGWRSDTVTEDLDLSYRAQIAGWRFVYLDSVVVPSELPISLSDFRGQQQRWGKGSIQTAKKILPALLKSSLPVSIKIEAAAHLLANLCWLFGFMATLTLYPLIITRAGIGPYQILKIDIPVFIFSGGAFLFYYLCHALSARKRTTLLLLPILPAFSIGLAPALSLAVLKGCFRTGGHFNRTPKLGLKANARPGKTAFKRPERAPLNLLMNLALLLYTFAPVGLALQRETWGAVPFLLIFPLGFFLMAGNELHDFFYQQ